MCAGGVSRRGHWDVGAALLLSLHRVGHDVDGLVDLHRDEAGGQDAWHLGRVHDRALPAHVAQLLRGMH